MRTLRAGAKKRRKSKRRKVVQNSACGHPVPKKRSMRLAEAHPARRAPPGRAVGGARETRATRRKRGTPRGGSGRGAGVDVPRQPSPRTPRERAREPAEEEKWIKRQWAFEDVADEARAAGARGRTPRGVARGPTRARRAQRWNERCVATNAASPDVPPRSSPARSPRAGSRRRREPASAMLASRETWRGPGCAVGRRTGWRARTPFT